MWQEIERRIADNEADTKLPPAPLRRSILAELKKSDATPAHAAKKMTAFKLPGDVTLLWELTSPSLNFFVAAPLNDSLAAAGFQGEPRPFDRDRLPNGGRHSALSLDWSFAQEDCVCVKIHDAADVIRLVSALSPQMAAIAQPTFSRDQIEGAINAFDDYRKRGANAEIFGAFGEPRDYWVRSSGQDKTGVYPTKPIVGFILKKTELNGGWGQKSDAAAQLHNSGYIIVDQNDRPVAVPDRYPHLMRGAYRARLVALNYFIEPARDVGEEQVSIRIGDVSANLFPNHHYRNVWQALRGKSFQELAKVHPPTQIGVDESPATVLTYQLISTKGQSAMTPVTTPQTSTTNLILYGPPGTGKTYHTAWEAVRLCLGDTDAERFRRDESRVALMAEYHRLVKEGRIEFVTFHQSMSYEEFVEGQKPVTGSTAAGDQSTDAAQGAGFRLEPEPGIFKRICEAARRGAGKADSAPVLEPDRSIFKLAINGDDPEGLNRKALEEGLIFWTRGGDINWEADRFSDFSEVRDRWRHDYPEADGRGADISGTFCFRTAVDVGDYVVLTWGRETFIGIGKVTGPYEYRPEPGLPPHRRTIEWVWSDWENGKDRKGLFEKKFSAWQPIYEFTDTQLDRSALNSLFPGAASSERAGLSVPYVLIIDEINRANVSKVFGELITLLEPDKRLGMENEIRLVLPYSKKPFAVPANLHIIGTMNTADRSIALLDTALRRRFTFRELMPDPSVLSTNVDGINLQAVLAKINNRIEYLFDREHQIGHAYFIDCLSRANVDEVMRHRVIPLLAEYFFEDWFKIAAVLGDLETHEGAITGGFLKRSVLKAPPSLDESGAAPRYRWTVRSLGEGFDYRKLLGA